MRMRAAACAGALAAALAACDAAPRAAMQPATDAAAAGSTAAAAAAGAPGAAGGEARLSGPVRTSVAPGQTGLEVVTWQVRHDGARFQEAMRRHGVPAVGALDELALRRNGFVVAAVRADRLDQLRDDLGGSGMDIRRWMGTTPSWRELAVARPAGAMLEVDGLARERPGATLRLMVRTWPLPMEDGTRIAVEIVPQVVTDELQASLVRNAGRLAGETIPSCAAGLELERDVAWIVTCDPGAFVETDAEAPTRAREAATRHGPPSPEPTPHSGKVGARIATLGTALLLPAPERAHAGVTAQQTVLVLVPHLDASPFPEAPPAEEPMTGKTP
ncbi:MAG: hypothetical protein ACKOQW_02690 [Phycisphaerales bacterium]